METRTPTIGELVAIPVAAHEDHVCISCFNEEDLEIESTHHYLPDFIIACPKCGTKVEYTTVYQVIAVNGEEE